MKHVLSIQSHVVYGHAGNSAAVFPMRRLGVEVWPVNTVQFSNHTQYGRWAGQALESSQITALVDGIAAIGELQRCDAVLSGYLGAPEQAAYVIEAVRKVRAANPQAIYLCDPVMGHPEKGCVVQPGIQQYLVEHMPAVADIMAPNHLELEKLAGRDIDSLADALAACRDLIARGPKLVLVKHLDYAGKPVDQFEMLVVSASEAWLGRRPLYPFDRQPVGVGDLTSGVFLARTLSGDDVKTAFEHTLAAVDAVMAATHAAGEYELQLVAAQDEIARPQRHFDAIAV
ncbi:pyridoxal kinase PdxY [Jeongeupia naejangsanensis]|uniref:Pyridoxal kinase PdxY n=1 Tax=Jeongeupia naejangsanensis TaxID=613195 RepID=A0ABS2BM91_9NEIS|nr:pyridoxal kinase PdxY [Jeongeupia naejangsanensis]MBM3115894.1 pyridoxal kinase PdxY [Jeongeupia naejangsanensis]